MRSNVNDMTVGSPTRAILVFALPLVLGYLLQQMYQVIDAAIVGQLIGVGALGAVGASSSVMFLVMGFCCGTCQGFAIPVAQAYGSRDMHRLQLYVKGGMRLSMAIAATMTVATCLLCRWILRLINTPETIIDDAATYLYLQFLLIPVAMAYNLLASYMRALGNSRQPFYFLIVSSVVNIALDLVFIALLHWGVAGAGLATIMAQVIAALLCWRFIWRHMPEIRSGMEDCLSRSEKGLTGPENRLSPSFYRRIDGRLYRHLLLNGLPMGLQFSITAIGSIMLQASNNALGPQYVAAFTASMRVKYLFTCVFENIGVAMATYCGQNIGAMKVIRIKQGIRAALLITMVYFLFTLAVIFPLADEMMLFFVDASETLILAESARFMRICNLFYPVLGLLTVLRYSIQGLGRADLSMLSGVMEMLARTGVSLLLVPALGFTGVILGDPTAWLAADLFLVPCYLMIYRKISQL